ncbi:MULTISPECIES: hypothetical protein [Providencia]|uniref:hypothetical protein n=1 Tax=Providencia TaxID=586 RepID=UPI0012B5BDA8|nr:MULTISPECIES: hypothetical protein [Providencia]MTC43699.1 hypothetical protein [Providencia sp. wls1921]
MMRKIFSVGRLMGIGAILFLFAHMSFAGVLCDPVGKIRIEIDGDNVCFSTTRIPECPIYALPATTSRLKVGFHCLINDDSINLSDDNFIDRVVKELSNKEIDYYNIVTIDDSCTCLLN